MSAQSLAEFAELSPAETVMLAGLGTGGFDRLGVGGIPEAPLPERTVRAELVRFCMLGGPDAPRLHEKGLRLSGAWITGTLDLEGCKLPGDVGLVDCRFEAPPILRSAEVGTVYLDGSSLPGIVAERVHARGSLYLRAVQVEGTILLAGARIGGEVVLDGAVLSAPGRLALDAPDIVMRGDVLLRGARCRGGLSLDGGRIGGSIGATGAELLQPGAVALSADSASFGSDVLLTTARIEGRVVFDGAHIGGDVDLDGGRFAAPGGLAVSFNRAVIAGAFFMRNGAAVIGVLSLNDATMDTIVDAEASWPAPGDLLLNRCRYGGFLGAPTDATRRLDWLGRQDPSRWGEDFWPQPYEQLAEVLTKMGHEEDARAVMMVKERLQRRARRVRANRPVVRAVLLARDALLLATVGYGRRPLRAVVWLAVFWAVGVALYAIVAARHEIRPNGLVQLRSPEWVLCGVPTGATLRLPSLDVERAGLAATGQSQLSCYLQQPEAQSFTTFNPWVFSLDALLPVLETGQRTSWSPDTRFALGHVGKLFEYLQTLAGWALGVLAVAGFSGIVKSR